MTNLSLLQQHLATLDRVVLGYSGGVDSALLAVAATDILGSERFLAVIGLSPSYPRDQYDRARHLASRFGIPLLEVETREMHDPNYLANSTNRCYFCKSELWRLLSRVAKDRGFDRVIDGTNADDLADHRPGMQAAGEIGVRSPLAELGWTKAMVRAAARDRGIPVWDAPASPCLSSRIQYGLPVTPQRLRQIEMGEAYLRTLGVEGDLRVRHHGDRVRIEASTPGQETVRQHRSQVEAFFARLGIGAVEIDPQGYRRGSLLKVLAQG